MGLFDFLKRKPSIPAEALCFWTHRDRHHTHLATLSKQQPPYRRVTGPLSSVLGQATDRGPVALTEAHLDGLQLDVPAAVSRAMANAQSTLRTGQRHDGVLVWQGAFVGALPLMAPLLREALSPESETVLMMPSEQVVLVANARDERGLRAMLDTATSVYGQSPEFVSLRAVSWNGADLQATEWLPPVNHPLHGAFRAAASRTLRHEAQADHAVFAKEAAPLAHLGALPEAHGGRFIASWMRDTSVVIPRSVERVVLVDTDDEPLPQLEVAVSTLREVVPHAFSPLPCETPGVQLDDARLLRASGLLFPTLGEKRFLLARQSMLDLGRSTPGFRDATGEELLAAWDEGEPVLARPSQHGVWLLAPDGRSAEVSEAEFGDRMNGRNAADRKLFEHAKAVIALVASKTGDEAASLSAVSRALDAASRIEVTRPALLQSSEGAPSDPFESTDDPRLLLERLSQQSLEPARLFPLVRPPGFERAQQANELGMVAGAKGEHLQVIHHARVAREGPHGLQFELVMDLGDRVVPLNAALVGDGMADVAWRTATLNLAAASIEAPHPRGAGWYEGPWHDDFDASRFLLQPALLQRCKVQGQPLLFAPMVGRTWVVGSDDVVAMTAVLDALEATVASPDHASPYLYRQLLFGRPWVFDGSRFTLWQVPQTHPLAARIAALDADLERRRDESTRHIGGFARGAYSPMPGGSAEA